MVWGKLDRNMQKRGSYTAFLHHIKEETQNGLKTKT